MKRLRTLLFWSHLAVGSAAGLVILVMSATGAALALKPQILRTIDRSVRLVEAHGRRQLPPSALLDAVRTARPGAQPVSLAVERDSAAAASVATEGGVVYVDPYDGRVLGQGSAAAQAFFRTLENWHRWLGAAGDQRPMARSITGAANVGFLALAVSGLYLWWPRRWSVQHARPILAFTRGATGRARDFNWHNVIGFWCAPAIIVMTLSGVVLSYPWANDLLYRVMGSTPPSATGERRGQAPSGPWGAAAVPDVDAAWAQAVARLPTWSAITIRLPNRAAAPVAITLSDGRSWNQFARSQLTVDAATGEVRQWQPYEASSLGQKARGWLRFAHTGELAGLGGQIVAGVGCLGGVVLVWTGLALACRRLVGWKLWKRARASQVLDTTPRRSPGAI